MRAIFPPRAGSRARLSQGRRRRTIETPAREASPNPAARPTPFVVVEEGARPAWAHTPSLEEIGPVEPQRGFHPVCRFLPCAHRAGASPLLFLSLPKAEALQLRDQLRSSLDDPDKLPPDVEEQRLRSLLVGLKIALNGWLER